MMTFNFGSTFPKAASIGFQNLSKSKKLKWKRNSKNFRIELTISYSSTIIKFSTSSWRIGRFYSDTQSWDLRFAIKKYFCCERVYQRQVYSVMRLSPFVSLFSFNSKILLPEMGRSSMTMRTFRVQCESQNKLKSNLPECVLRSHQSSRLLLKLKTWKKFSDGWQEQEAHGTIHAPRTFAIMWKFHNYLGISSYRFEASSSRLPSNMMKKFSPRSCFFLSLTLNELRSFGIFCSLPVGARKDENVKSCN